MQRGEVGAARRGRCSAMGLEQRGGAGAARRGWSSAEGLEQRETWGSTRLSGDFDMLVHGADASMKRKEGYTEGVGQNAARRRHHREHPARDPVKSVH